MAKPRLLDLFCGAGGAAMGYYRAGFDVVGIDIAPHPSFPFEFIQADAMTFPLEGFDAVHASPPCQHYSVACRGLGTENNHPDLLPGTRARLTASGLPWVIENVPGSPMRADVVLCGCMFGLNLRRIRWFETSPRIFAMTPPHHHVGIPIGVYGHGTNSSYRKKLGRNATVKDMRKAMGIDWMTREDLVEAIPPAYTEWIGAQLLRHLMPREEAV